MSEKQHLEDVIVIGGGPAGLALSHSLALHGVDPLVLECGDAAGWSWANMPRNISLLSPWKVNHLPGTKANLANLHYMHGCQEFAAYLQEYARQHRLRLQTGTRVESVARDGDGFSLQTNHGSLRARAVVNATGYFTKPKWPTYQGMKASNIRQLHVHDFKSAAETHAELGLAKPRVLVVGRRISAGQTLAELHDAGLGFDVVLSRRGPVSFAPPPWLLKLSFWLFYRWEDAQVRKDPYGLDDTFPPMEGGREKQLLISGKVSQAPDIARLHADEVEFVDSSRQRFDLIIYTTGFLPALDHLEGVAAADPDTGLPSMDEMQSTDAPGLYFMGLDKQRSFRSRYLRGIREDAPLLAEQVAAQIDRARRQS